MIEDMRIRNLSAHTQATYVLQVSLFARHFGTSPEALGPEEVRAYQVYLTSERRLAVGSVLIALGALRFLYKITLKRDWRLEDLIPLCAAVGSRVGAVVSRRAQLLPSLSVDGASLATPSLRLRPPPHRTGRAGFPHPAHREGVIHRGYASVWSARAFALAYARR
jgi:hypothetical protein